MLLLHQRLQPASELHSLGKLLKEELRHFLRAEWADLARQRAYLFQRLHGQASIAKPAGRCEQTSLDCRISSDHKKGVQVFASCCLRSATLRTARLHRRKEAPVLQQRAQGTCVRCTYFRVGEAAE